MNSKTVTLVVCLLAIAVPPLLAGGPGLSIEIKDAVVMVRVHFHDKNVPDSLTGTAEGILNGKRQSLDLRLLPTPEEGVFTVKQQWPAEGNWVLTITATEHATQSAVIKLGANGSTKNASVNMLTRKATEDDVTAALKK